MEVLVVILFIGLMCWLVHFLLDSIMKDSSDEMKDFNPFDNRDDEEYD